MNVILRGLPPAASPVEVVERKGLGHPDTMADALAEGFSAALCRFYLDRFGRIAHHNVDKALIFGGSSRPAFGGGAVLAPIEIYLAGRVTTRVGDVEVPVADIAQEVTRTWLRANLRYLDPERHVRVHCLARSGSIDLHDVFARESLACNDTSIGVGWAPDSPLERVVKEVEARLRAPEVQRAHPSLGEDIKVMGVRRGRAIDLTVAVAMVDRFLAGPEAYLAAKRAVADQVRSVAELGEVWVNAADDPARGSFYLTVTGTSAEAGDDGQVGRGNRANGVITPMRPMSLEAPAGKNPVTHVGKLYNLVAQRAARRMVEELEDVASAQVILVSRIGAPIQRPWLADVALETVGGAPTEPLRDAIDDLLLAELARMDELTQELVRGAVAVF